MKFDIWTFLFQIINFAVLLFILRRILYKPIRSIIEKRRGLIEKTIEDTERTKQEALELKKQHQDELNTYKELHIQMLEKAKEDAENERGRLLSEAEKEAKKVLEKEKGIYDAEKRRLEALLKDKAIESASIFASRLLRDISDKELHNALFRKVLTELGQITSDITKINEKEETIEIEIISAFALEKDELKNIQDSIESHISKKVTLRTKIDNTLIAGVKIKAYDMIYDSSLLGQIEAFTIRMKETV
ncbi:MAG: F0F1 ATP synthase subunit delta [Candidatus Brocadiaceae bacterium]|nr:F0F1 ATP synthase subunit delta [Candidatus Brocadiaceae bacterium]